MNNVELSDLKQKLITNFIAKVIAVIFIYVLILNAIILLTYKNLPLLFMILAVVNIVALKVITWLYASMVKNPMKMAVDKSMSYDEALKKVLD